MTTADTGPARTHSLGLDPNIITATADGSRIGENILYFGRLLRSAGLPVGPDKIVLATEAVMVTGLSDIKTLYWTLHAVFVNRRTERDIFNQAFVMFWKDPSFINQMMSLMLPSLKSDTAPDDKALSRRMSESLFKNEQKPAAQKEDQLEIDAIDTFSAAEVLREKDFEQMSVQELADAKRAMQRLHLPFEELRTRRYERATSGARLDLRRMLRNTGARGPDYLLPVYQRRRVARPPIVVLVDISGSMDTYARVFMHFLYALTNDRDRVYSFLFGTRLSHVTRALKDRDPDVAIGRISKDVLDWSGGTRIGHCLSDFNQHWARRVLGQNAVVLLFTDGLDREGGDGLATAARRLKASSRRLIWLNPLLRYDQYQPIASGARALSEHITEMRGCHNLRSLEDLAVALRTR
jgi:uncharacterized protein